jgi:hypothetical protein
MESAVNFFHYASSLVAAPFLMLVHAGLLVVLLKPFELRDDDVAGRERVPVFARGALAGNI